MLEYSTRSHSRLTAFDGVLSIGDLNLSSSRTRQSQAKYLAERAQADDLDWTGR